MLVWQILTGMIILLWLYMNSRILFMTIRGELNYKIYWFFFLEVLFGGGAIAWFVSIGSSPMAYIIIMFCFGMFLPASRDIIKNGQDELNKQPNNHWGW